MKSLLLTMVTVLFCTVLMQAQTWNGTISNSWTNPLNWTPNTVPGASSVVTISNVGISPKLQGNTAVGLLTINTGTTLDVNGFSLTIGNGLSGYSLLNGANIVNTNASTDIVFNIVNGNTGYNFTMNGSTVNDKITFNLSGSDVFYEGTSANQFNGDVVYNINGPLTTYFSNSAASQYSSHLNINRTVAGSTYIFNSGATVGGNFNYQNLVGGLSIIGSSSVNTTINGTCTMNINNPSTSTFALYRVKNLTLGGIVNIQNTLGCNVKDNELKLTSFTLQGYRGSNYAQFFNNLIQGTTVIADHVSYTSGYNTDFRSNVFTGNVTITINGDNHLYESQLASNASVYNGNTNINLNGNGQLFLCQGDKSTFNGNLIINRTVAGYSRAFNFGAIINGNFVYNNSAAGDVDLGSLSNPTNISGTINVNVNFTAISGFAMNRLINQTAGGKINVYNSKGFDFKNDSLKVDSLNIVSYRGNAYGYFYNNKLDGHLQLADSTSYTSGYNTNVQNNTINGNTQFKIYGTNTFVEASSASLPNSFNGNLTITITGSGSVYTSQSAKSTITGNFTVNRTGAGYTRLFANGATIGGNFSYTKSGAGASDLGLISNKTSVAGTVNLNVTQTTGDDFSMHRIQNLTNGGSILVQNTKSPSVQQDSLLLTSMSFTGYGGSAYAYFYNNQLTGNVTIQDNAAFSGGYSTHLRDNTINGTTTCTILGTNTFYEADLSSSANIFNGHLTINCNSSGSLYISHNDKSTYNGNVTITRTIGGITKAFNFGATINGNLSYSKNAPGTSEFGFISRKTSISGTINMNITQTTSDPLELFWLVNATPGGSITAQDTRLNFQRDSLKVTSLSVNGYGGGAYGYFYDNKIDGNLTLSDNPLYGGGYSTHIRNNIINGNSSFTLLGTNTFNEADAASSGNVFNGNVIFQCNGLGVLSISNGDKTTYNGHLTINRTVAGTTKAFNFGADITGNFAYTKNASGASEFGNMSRKTSISGTINMNITQTTADPFELFWIVNNTTGGSINVQDTRAFSIQRDSLKLISCTINGYSGGTYAYLYDNRIEGNVTTSDNASYGGGYSTHYRNNTITGNCSFTTSGGNVFNDGDVANSGNTYVGNVTYTRNSGAMNVGTGDTSSYAGNFTLNNSAALPINTEMIRFNGNANTSIDQLGSGSIDIQKLIINKSASAKLTLNKRVNIPTSCSFVSGYIISTTANPLVFPNNINHTGAGDNSHVIGCVIKKGDDVFTFPLGNGIGYHPLAITAPSAATDSFRACIVLKHPSDDGFNVNSKDAALLQIAPYHYWTLDQLQGSNLETVSLGWSIPCANTVIASLPGMAVARWNGTQWNNLGNSATSGTTSLGTVTMSGTTANYGTFALATTSALNSWQITSVTASASTVCAGTATLLTGAGASTYNWQPGNLNGTSVSVTPLTTTVYTVTGTSATGCITTATKTIVVNPLPPTSTTTTASVICAGLSVTITGTGANTYTWMPGSLSGTSITVSPASTTTYTVTGTFTATGCTQTAIRTITVNPLPAVSTSATATTLCTGASTTITASNANTYVWQPGGSTSNPLTVTPASTTTYTVTGTNTATGCTKTSTRLITVNPLPAVSTSATATTLCAGASTTITAANANTYVWQPGGSTSNPLTVTPASTTTYTVTGTNTATGCTNTSTRLITVNPLPAVSTSATATTLCAGASTTITAANANTYVWQPGGSTTNPLTVTPASTTIYTVTGTNTATGCTNTSTRLITVNPLPAVSTSATATTLCAGASTTITAANANTYVWQPGSLTTNPITVTPASTTTYTVTGTNTATGCTNTSTRLITVNALPAVSTTATATTLCAGASTTITAANANTYVWQPGGLTTNPITVTPASTTTYTVTGTNTATGCSKTSTRVITVNPLPAVSTSATATTICAGASTTITATNANTYVWQPGGLTTNPITVTPASTTTYTVTGANTATGCTNTSTRTITVNVCSTTLNLKLFLQGFYTGASTMSPVLFNQSVTGNNSITDTITVQLRNTTAPYAVAATTKAILNTDGTATCSFTPFVSGSYYVVVNHRNSVQTWSASPVTVGAAPATYDFSNLITKAYGSNMKLVSTTPNVYAFYTGDVNHDENVDVIDISVVENDISSFLFGYQITDINGDGNVDILDSPLVDENVANFVFSSHP